MHDRWEAAASAQPMGSHHALQRVLCESFGEISFSVADAISTPPWGMSNHFSQQPLIWSDAEPGEDSMKAPWPIEFDLGFGNSPVTGQS